MTQAVTLAGLGSTTPTIVSPTLTSPVLGTPVSGSLVNCTDVNYTGFKNRIINGGMVIDQRNAGASVTVSTTSSAFTVDRFFGLASDGTGTFTLQQSTTTTAGFKNSIIATVGTTYTPSGSNQYNIRHNIEGFNISDLGWGTANAQTITLSFWVRASVTGTYGGSLSNSAFNRSYPFTFAINSANTYEYKTITIAGDTSGTWLTDNGIGIRLIISLGASSTLQGAAGAWAAGAFTSATGTTNWISNSGATFYITGVQLEKGSVATSFDQRAYSQELAMCQRYYQYASSMNMPGLIKGTSDTNRSLNIWFSSTMRAAPTMSVTWNSGAQTGSDWVGTNGAHSYKAAGDTSTQLVVTAWTASTEI